MATEVENDDGVRWLLVRAGTRRVDLFATARGRFRWLGDYWQPVGGWGPIETACYYTTAERDSNPDGPSLFGGEWVQVFVNVDPVGVGA